jgi:hypothetical protein
VFFSRFFKTQTAQSSRSNIEAFSDRLTKTLPFGGYDENLPVRFWAVGQVGYAWGKRCLKLLARKTSCGAYSGHLYAKLRLALRQEVTL